MKVTDHAAAGVASLKQIYKKHPGWIFLEHLKIVNKPIGNLNMFVNCLE